MTVHRWCSFRLEKERGGEGRGALGGRRNMSSTVLHVKATLLTTTLAMVAAPFARQVFKQSPLSRTLRPRESGPQCFVDK